MCTRKRVSINVCRQTLGFRVTTPTYVHLQSFRFLPVATLKNPGVFSSNWKWRGTSRAHVWCLSNHSQPPRDLWKGATVCDQKWPRGHWFRLRTFWVSVINCTGINNKNWSVIKLGRCTVNVLCQLWLKYYIVKVVIVDCNFSFKLKTTYFRTHVCLNVCFVFVLRTRSWNLSDNSSYKLFQ
jgi:hypothetical protein